MPTTIVEARVAARNALLLFIVITCHARVASTDYQAHRHRPAGKRKCRVLIRDSREAAVTHRVETTIDYGTAVKWWRCRTCGLLSQTRSTRYVSRTRKSNAVDPPSPVGLAEERRHL